MIRELFEKKNGSGETFVHKIISITDFLYTLLRLGKWLSERFLTRDSSTLSFWDEWIRSIQFSEHAELIYEHKHCTEQRIQPGLQKTNKQNNFYEDALYMWVETQFKESTHLWAIHRVLVSCISGVCSINRAGSRQGSGYFIKKSWYYIYFSQDFNE